MGSRYFRLLLRHQSLHPLFVFRLIFMNSILLAVNCSLIQQASSSVLASTEAWLPMSMVKNAASLTASLVWPPSSLSSAMKLLLRMVLNIRPSWIASGPHYALHAPAAKLLDSTSKLAVSSNQSLSKAVSDNHYIFI